MATIAPQRKSIGFVPEKKIVSFRYGKIPIAVWCLFLILSIGMLSLLYLSGFNHISSQGVVIGELESKRSKLIIENEVWNMRVAKLKSLDVIEQQDIVKKMPSIDPREIEFLDASTKNNP